MTPGVKALAIMAAASAACCTADIIKIPIPSQTRLAAAVSKASSSSTSTASLLSMSSSSFSSNRNATSSSSSSSPSSSSSSAAAVSSSSSSLSPSSSQPSPSLSASGGAAASSVQDIALEPVRSGGYRGIFEVGTPAKSLKALFSTGISETVLVPIPAQPGTDTHDLTTSSTFSDVVAEADANRITRRVGPLLTPGSDLHLHFGSDVVRVGELNLGRLNMALPSFGYSEGSKFDLVALIGLGPSSQNSSNFGAASTLLEAVDRKGFLDEQVFGLYLPEDEEGHLILGGVDADHIASEFTWIPAITPTPELGGWIVELESITVGGENLGIATNKLLLRSGVNILAGPRKEVEKLRSMLSTNEYLVSENGDFVAPCDKIRTLGISLGGMMVNLEAEELTSSRDPDSATHEDCTIPLHALDDWENQLWAIGDSLFHKYYAQFDWANLRVGLATAKKSSDNLV